MNDHFEGVQFEWNGNGYNQQHNDVSSVIAGRRQPEPIQVQATSTSTAAPELQHDARQQLRQRQGNATVFFSYQKTDGVLQNYRDFSRAPSVSAAASCGGSAPVP